MIRISEFNFLLGHLKDIKDKPYLYGEPDAIKIIIKYLVVCCFNLKGNALTYEDVVSLWFSLEERVGGSTNDPVLKPVWQRSNEVSLNILMIYSRLWKKLKDQLPPSQFYQRISYEVDNLLGKNQQFINPDITAMTYRNLMGFCFIDESYQVFLIEFNKTVELENLGASSMGLQGMGDFIPREPIFDQWDMTYQNISEVTEMVINLLLAKR